MVGSQEQIQGMYLPDFDRVSVLAGMITLAYIMTHFIDIPAQELALQLPGIYLAVQININTLVGILVGGLTAVGADWVFQDHPALRGRTLPYLILPALSAWVIGLPLSQIPFGWGWWLILAGGVLMLTLVLVGEYISINIEDIRQPLAVALLTAASFTLFLILAISLRSEGTRLFLALPGLTLGAGLVSLRVLHLRLQGQWLVYEGAIIAFIVSQITAALYYWPITPVAFGVLILGPTYALTSLIAGLVEERSLRSAMIEPVLAIVIAIGVAVWAS
jgi:hypothetical protein